MENLSWGEIITVLIASAIKLGLAGIPTAVFGFGYGFLKTLVVCSTGGILGTLVYTFLIDGILKGVSYIMDKIRPNRNANKKKFTRTNRLIIKVKRNFGIIGVSAISPSILSLPLGVFLCLKFFRNKTQIIFWMSIFVVFWTIVLYFIYHHFYNSLVSFFD